MLVEMRLNLCFICIFICWGGVSSIGIPAKRNAYVKVVSFMRIAIDYTAAIRQGAGIGVYVRNLVDAMLAQDIHNQYTLLTSGQPTAEHPFPTAENARGR